jgi:hypothetical protein
VLKAIVLNETLALFTAALMSAVLTLIYNTFDQAWYFFFFWLSILQLFVAANVARAALAKNM